MLDKKACELIEDFKYYSFPKGTFLLEENKINKQTYFLEEGYVRSFAIDKDGKEVTTNIYSAPCFVNDLRDFREFIEFGRFLVVYNYDILYERMLGMIKNTAENRYLKLLLEHPDIYQYVSLKIIASYLGITDTSLSRIRKEILRK
jgi:hypothetical protein